MTTANPAGDYDAYARQYAANVAWREQGGVEGDPFGLLPPLLALLGDITGCRVLDAGCGEGYLARVLAAREARVTGIDLSPRLIELARVKNPTGDIDYRVADLSQPVPGIAGRFDAVASYLVLNDVQDYRGFAATLAALLKPGGRAVLALNNPYGAVAGRHVADYFSSGTASPYRGLWEAGIKTYNYHRTLEDYLDAILSQGLHLTKLADIAARADSHRPDACLPDGARFPRFMLLEFRKPGTALSPPEDHDLGGSGTGAFPQFTARFQSPPVKPCMRFSRTRLTDVLHRRRSVFPRQSRKGLGGGTVPSRLIRPR